MYAPEWRICDEHIFKCDILASEKLYKMRSKLLLHAIVALLYGHLLMILAAQSRLTRFLVSSPLGECFDAVAVNGSSSRDNHILKFESIDERRNVLAERTLPRCLYSREIISRFG